MDIERQLFDAFNELGMRTSEGDVVKVGSYCSICHVDPCCHSLGGTNFGRGGECACAAIRESDPC